MPLTPLTQQFDPLFKSVGQKHGLPWRLLKAVAVCESSLNSRAYRFEPDFWRRYLEQNPEWKARDPQEVSASYGLMQLMYTTAYQLGYRGAGIGLYAPGLNIDLGARLLRRLYDGAKPVAERYDGISVIDVTLARYNGGFSGNPDGDGNLRNMAYADRVIKVYEQLRQEA